MSKLKLDLRSIKVGSTLYIFSPELREQIIPKAEAGLRRGETVTWEDGRKQWQTTAEILDTTQTGSKMYTWRGEKVKAKVFLHTKTKNGKVTREEIGTRFIDLGT